MNWKSAKTKVARFSGFDKSFHSVLTQQVGTLYPIFVDEVVPNSNTQIGVNLTVKMPPFAFDTFMNTYYCIEAFFVPTRLLFQGYEYYYANMKRTLVNGNQETILAPVINIPNSGDPQYSASQQTIIGGFISQFTAVNTLTDALGFRSDGSAFMNVTSPYPEADLSALPFLAYHRIYDDWYRNPRVQVPVFSSTSAGAAITGNLRLRGSRYTFFNSSNYRCGPLFSGSSLDTSGLNLNDSVPIYQLRQRNWGFDPYTTGLLSTEYQDSVQKVAIETSGGQSYFTIPSLRGMNSIQMFLDRNSLSSPRLNDMVHARTGANLSDSLAQKPVLIRATRVPIIVSPVLQNSMNSGSTQNPFNSVGAQYGNAHAACQDFRIKFHADEPGYIFIIGSVVPDAAYSYGVNPLLMRYCGAGSITDMADANLEMAGSHKVNTYEIANRNLTDGFVHSYNDAYYSFKDRVSEVHGLFRVGQSLSAAVVQRALGPNTSLNTSFLQIATSAMDNVTAVSGALSQYGAMVDCYFDFRQTMPLHSYCVPSLVDPAFEHGNSVSVNRGGTQIR